ncbi:metallophosphoesterase family protein [Tumebacillus lipolyticus]|uniref:Metallophosphoesterase family protein n=1 Tax=Tumebacillus lipolyticus TaxID=1280370 RepID=A0ABW4ZTY5_9BACL
MEKRLLVCSDIHGQYDQFIELLDKASYDPAQDQLILLGDYIDRGPKSRQVIEKVIELVERDGALALKGNHDQMMIDSLGQMAEEKRQKWEQINGGAATLQSYADEEELYVEHACWMRDNLKLYHETAQYIFVHAGVRPGIPMEEQLEYDLIWIRHREECGLGKLIVHGHTSVDEVEQVFDQLFIDTGSVYGNKLTMIELPSRAIYEVAEPIEVTA